MKKFVIGVDVDGVLRDLIKKCVDVYNDKYGALCGEKEVKDITNYYVEKSFSELKKYENVNNFFFQKNKKELFLNSDSMQLAKTAMDILSKIGNVLIISYQPSLEDKMYTLQWLNDKGINYDGICFLNKKEYISADYLIDDNQEFLLKFLESSPKKKGILINAPYNKEINNELLKYKERFVICNNLYEAIKYIN